MGAMDQKCAPEILRTLNIIIASSLEVAVPQDFSHVHTCHVLMLTAFCRPQIKTFHLVRFLSEKTLAVKNIIIFALQESSANKFFFFS